MVTTTQVHGDNRMGNAATAMPNDAEPRGARLAADVREALQTAPYVPQDHVDVEVREHAVYLSGMVKWNHQRVAAQRAVERLPGVHVLRNSIRVMPQVSASEIRSKILAALYGGDSADRPHHIDVFVDGESVVLAGVVASYADRHAAERIAHGVPHVHSVCNLLRIVRT